MPAVLRRHLLDSGVPEGHVTMCLQPNDKQDVPLAYLLLTEVSKLPPPKPSDPALYAETRCILNVLGKIFSAIIDPYTNRLMSL
jgi:hypothetical protein